MKEASAALIVKIGRTDAATDLRIGDMGRCCGLEKVVGSITTLYLGAEIERDPTGAYTYHLNPDVKRVGTALHYLHRDHLNSVRRVTDVVGAIYRASTYKPFGTQIEEVLNPLTPPESKGFIGERFDAESGLTYLNARYYDAALVRFLSPDWWDPATPTTSPGKSSTH